MIRIIYFCFLLILFFFLSGSSVSQSCFSNPIGKLHFGFSGDSVKVKMLLDSSSRYMAVDFKKALEIAKIAENISINSKDKKLLKQTSLQLGRLFFFKGLLSKAIDYNIRLLEISKKDKDFEGMGKANFQLGGIRLLLEDYNLAETHFLQSKNHFLMFYKNENQFPLNIKIGFCNNLGVIYSGLGKYEEAQKQFEEGIRLAQGKPDFRSSLVQLFNNIGDIMLKKSEFVKAEFFFKEAMSIVKLSPNILMESMIFNSLGKLQLELKDYNLAKNYFIKGYSLAQTIQGFSHLKHLSENLSTAYHALGKSDSALVFLQLSKNYTDSLDLKNSSEKILQQEMLASFSLEKSEMENSFSKSTSLMATVIFGFILLFLFFVYLFFKVNKILHYTSEEKSEVEMLRKKSYEVNERLNAEIDENKKVLTLLAIKSIQNNEVLNQITETLQTNKASNLDFEFQGKLDELISKLKQDKGEKAYSELEYRFNNVYVGFFEKLKKDFPDLTLNERRLAAFLKLQLTTKEITNITGQSVRAVEIARTRMRKKLKLTKTEKSLNDFFADY